MRRTDADKRRYYRYAAIAFSVLFVLSVAFFFLSMWDSNRGVFSGEAPADKYLSYQGRHYELKDNVETFLILGLDKFEDTAVGESYNNNKQSDFMLLLVYDHSAKTCAAVHINRDTMVDMNVLGVAGNKVGTVNKQLALAHTYGNGKDVSCRNAANAVSKLLMDVRIDHYLSVTMDGVPLFNDLVGGVEVEVLDDFTGIDDALIKGQTVTLKGKQALTYVRTRYGLEDSTNSTRMARQRQYLAALREQTDACIDNDSEFVVTAAVKMSDYIISDRSVNQMKELAERYYSYESLGQLELAGESRLGENYMEFYPDQQKLQELVVGLFYQEVTN